MTPAEYVAHGWTLIPIPAGEKGPSAKGWNARGRCVVPPTWRGNIGLAHAYSGTCAIDIDDMNAAAAWLNERGVSLADLLADPRAVRISSGRPNRAKLLYRLADPLRSKKIILERRNIIDFRCATAKGTTVQDVLPPSIHPDTHQPYVWDYADELVGHWSTLPEIPAPLLEVWCSLITSNAPTAEDAEHEPVDIDELRGLLEHHDPTCDREAWVRVLAAIHHGSQGSAQGLGLADEWSAKGGDKYAGRDDVERVWRSFSVEGDRLVTAASLRVDLPADLDDFEVIVPAEASASPSDSQIAVTAEGAKAAARLPFERDEDDLIFANLYNLRIALKSDVYSGVKLAFDTFRDEVMVSPRGSDAWQPFTDADYVRLRLVYETTGFKTIGRELMRDAVTMVAADERFDSAVLWLNALPWDGVPRVGRFLEDYFGVESSPYARAVSMYLWTAAAGRVLDPGCKADMVPILIGPQGAGKTTGVAAMVPSPDHFVEIDLSERDTDLARKMRGRLIGEIGELRGLNSRELESIKTFITRTHETWVAKYKEFAETYPRRLVFIGTTNNDEFLADDTGNRRWLPVRVGKVNVAGVRDDRLQLWAEARELFSVLGVAYQDAERLGAGVHGEHSITDLWQENIVQWLDIGETDDLGGKGSPRRESPFSMVEILTGALGLDMRFVGRKDELRVARILRGLGFEKKQAKIRGQNLKAWVALGSPSVALPVAHLSTEESTR